MNIREELLNRLSVEIGAQSCGLNLVRFQNEEWQEEAFLINALKANLNRFDFVWFALIELRKTGFITDDLFAEFILKGSFLEL